MASAMASLVWWRVSVSGSGGGVVDVVVVGGVVVVGRAVVVVDVVVGGVVVVDVVSVGFGMVAPSGVVARRVLLLF